MVPFKTFVLTGLVALTLVGCKETGDTEVTNAKPAPEPSVVQVNVTPDSCSDALDFANQVIDLAGDALGAASEGFTGVSELDAEKVNAASAKVGPMAAKMQTLIPKYIAMRDQCLAAK